MTDILDLIGILVIIFLGLLIAIAFYAKFQVSLSHSFMLYVWHSTFCFIYVAYVNANGGDAIGYFNAAQTDEIKIKFGTSAVEWLTALFSRYFGLSFISTSLVYNIFGFIGLLALSGSLRQVTQFSKNKVRQMVSLLVFLPSINFWSSGIGKDSIAVMAVCLALWASIALVRRWKIMVFSILVMLVVRPHIAGLMIVALALATVFKEGGITGMKWWMLIVVLIAGSSVAVPFALEYAGLGGPLSVSDVNEYFETRQGYNQEGGGGIDISQMSLPMQLFTYLFRPLPFEASGVAALAASIENVLLMFFFLYAARCWFIGRKKYKHYSGITNTAFVVFFALTTWGVLAMTTANLGISLRQKWMFMPMFFYVAAAAIASANPIQRKVC